jgi:aspartate racemase
MKTPGVIGGIGPESTVDYYRSIVAVYQARTRDGSAPPLLIKSIDNKRMIDHVTAGRWPEVTAYLLENIQQLARGGADFALLSANTPHIIFDDLARQAPIPLLSIVEVTCQAAQKRGLKRLGLFGTRYTMQAAMFPEVFRHSGLGIVIPSVPEQERIHAIYMGELFFGRFLPESRQELLRIAQRLRDEECIDGLILGGTELPLLLRESVVEGLPFLDTTQLHVQRIVDEMLT